MNNDKKTNTTEIVPFFARQVAAAPIVVRTGLRAGAAEASGKHREEASK